MPRLVSSRFNVMNIPLLRAWHDSSDTKTVLTSLAPDTPAQVNDTIRLWLDKSGNGNHVGQITEALRPIKLNQGISFLNRQLWGNASHNLNSGSTFLAVAQMTSLSSAWRGMIMWGYTDENSTAGGVARGLYQGAKSAVINGMLTTGANDSTDGAISLPLGTNRFVIVGQFQGGVQRLWINGVFQNETARPPITEEGLQIRMGWGRIASETWNGNIFESVVSGAVLPMRDIDFFTRWAAKKWNITL